MDAATTDMTVASVSTAGDDEEEEEEDGEDAAAAAAEDGESLKTSVRIQMALMILIVKKGIQQMRKTPVRKTNSSSLSSEEISRRIKLYSASSKSK